MKGIGKSIIVLGILGTTLGIGNMHFKNEINALEKTEQSVIKEYIHNPNNILENTYTINGEIILPFIFDNADESISVNYVKNQFAQAGKNITSISTSEIVTGTKIIENNIPYTVVIFGDVNSDGYVDMFDAQAISDHYIFGGVNTLTGVDLIAANVENSDNEVDMFDAQRIADFYLGFERKLVINEPIADSEKVVEEEIYIEDIEITSLPNDIEYYDGETISTAGMVVNAIMTNGEKCAISLSDTNLKTTPTIAKVGENTITVSYTTGNTENNVEKTFSKTFQITVVKQIENLVVEQKAETGYQYKEIQVASVTSGADQEYINIEELSWEIKRDGQIITDENVAKVGTKLNQFDKSIELSFMASEVGTYTITPKLGDMEGTKIIVTIEKNTEVNEIVIEEIEDLIIGETITIPVEFFYNYDKGEKLEVEADRIEITQKEGVQVELLNETKDQIVVETAPKAIVKYIYIKALEAGEKTLTVKVDECSVSKTITISDESASTAEVKIEGLTDSITLYLSKPQDNDMVKEDNGYIYTLVSIYLEDSNGNKTKLSKSDIKLIPEASGKVSIIDQEAEIGEVPCICIEGYKKVGDTIEKVSSDSEEVDYIGIAIDTGAEADLIGGYIKIFNEEMANPIKLNVIIPTQEVSELVVTPKNQIAEQYETIEIASVTSGFNEKNIDVEDLTWEIKKDSQTITDESIAKVEAKVALDKSIVLSFVATQVGTYTITPKLGEITGTEITVTIENNTQVNEISIGEIEDLTIEQTTIIPVEFLYNSEDVAVTADRIEITKSGIDVKLLTETQDTINVEETPKAIVKYIYIKALEAGEKTLTIRVDEITASKTITISEESISTKTEVKVGLTDSITLYLSKPENNDMVKEDDEGYIYTLVSIYLEDENGNKTKLTKADIKQLQEETGTVSIIDNVMDTEPDGFWTSICLEGYKKSGDTITKVISNSEEIDYIGIAICTGCEDDLRDNGYIKIFNDEMTEPIVLNIIIEE